MTTPITIFRMKGDTMMAITAVWVATVNKLFADLLRKTVSAPAQGNDKNRA
jgi:hypothetical protein